MTAITSLCEADITSLFLGRPWNMHSTANTATKTDNKYA